MQLSGIVITKNEETHIKNTVESLFQVCDEVIVVDSGSSDNTVKVAEQYGARVFFNEWTGYKEQRNYADTLASHDWILVLDADERLDEQIIKSIKKVKSENFSEKYQGFTLGRSLFFMNKWFNNNYFTCEKKVRLYNRNYSEWTGGRVHEKLHVNGKVKRLKGFIEHIVELPIAEILDKFNKYAHMRAKDRLEQGRRVTIIHIWFTIIFTFIKKYFLQFKFLRGAEGLILAWLETNYSTIKYMRLYELQTALKEEKANE